ncbi:major facilitator superfamily domain-containing protein [Chaetomium sp. MPI-CAGE-AT-0009]|nr:major facilitator superfamily domain-containing protein [Chaetomium sp. MPI-CAGE-AT-0009]
MGPHDIASTENGKATEVEIEDAKVVLPEAVVTHYAPVNDDERELDKSVNWKLDVTVLLLLAISFILCGIDKTNVGFVATSSFIKDANLHPDDIPNSLSLFSATYVPLQPLAALLARRLGPHRYLPLQLIAWGALCMAHAGIRSSATLIALRLLLGAAEAGFTQTAFYYMSLMYPKFSLGFRMGLFTGMYAVAGAFAGLIAYGLLKVETGVVRGWQVVFLVEGGVTVLVGVLAFGVLPREVGTAWFLGAREREHAVGRMERDLAGMQEVVEFGEKENGVAMRDLLDVVKDWRKMLIIVFNITAVLPVTAFTTFLPLIIQGMDYEGVTATLMSVPPFVVGVVGLLILVYSSDHFHERSLHTVFGMLLGLIGCAVMVASSDPKLRYGFAHVCLTGVFASGPLVAVWLAGNTPWKAARSFVLGLNGYSNLAGVIAGQLFKSAYAPTYAYPLTVTMILSAVGMLGFLFVRGAYMFENRKRKKITATWTEDDFINEQASIERRGDQRYTWVYGY